LLPGFLVGAVGADPQKIEYAFSVAAHADSAVCFEYGMVFHGGRFGKAVKSKRQAFAKILATHRYLS
jgi:hypothetical protein